MTNPIAEDMIQHIRNEVEYILDDDTVGEVRVTYGDGRSEIKQARVLLVDDIMRVVEGAYNVYTTNKIIGELERLVPEYKPTDSDTVIQNTAMAAILDLKNRIAELRKTL